MTDRPRPLRVWRAIASHLDRFRRQQPRTDRPQRHNDRRFGLEALEPRLLLAGDLVVFAAAGEALNLSARLDAATQTIELVDNASNAVVASRLLIDFAPGDRVRVIGNDRDDQLTVDYGAGGGFAVAIDFDGGAQAGAGDSLSVRGSDNLWSLTAVDAGTVAASAASGPAGAIHFGALERLSGGAGADRLTDQSGNAAVQWLIGNGSATYRTGSASLLLSSVETLVGGVGDDRFVLAEGASLAGGIDGGAGRDTLDASQTSSARLLQLTALGAADGFSGSDAALGGGFANVDAFIGGAGSDALRGLDGDALWQLGASTRYVGARSADLQSFETLVGGSGADRFMLTQATLALLSGGGGSDTLDFSAAAQALDLRLLRADANGFAGDGSVRFDGIDQVLGSASTADRLRDAGSTGAGRWALSDTPSFSDGSHTLGFNRIDDLAGRQGIALAFGAAGDTTARALSLRFDLPTRTLQLVDSTTAALVDETVITQPGDNLVRIAGTAGSDRLRIDRSVADAGLVVVFNAAGGSDALDLAALPGAAATTLLDKVDGAGFAGIGPVAFRGVDALVGAALAGTTLRDATGAATATWTLGSGTAGYSDGPHSLAISGFATLAGGAGSDRFDVTAAQPYALSGGGGSDTLDFGAAAAARQVLLTRLGSVDGFAGSQAWLAGGFDGIDRLLGSAVAGDALTGLDAAAVWTLDGNNRYLSGGRALGSSS